jgi:hypothetical protein
MALLTEKEWKAKYNNKRKNSKSKNGNPNRVAKMKNGLRPMSKSEYKQHKIMDHYGMITN